MSDNICPKCNSKVGEGNNFCQNCGFPLDNQKEDIKNSKKNDFLNFKDDFVSKIQNRLDKENVIKTDDIKEMIKNLDENSLKKLTDKHSISMNNLKTFNFNKLFDKIDINKLKEDLVELGIIASEFEYDDKKVKSKTKAKKDSKVEVSEEDSDSTDVESKVKVSEEDIPKDEESFTDSNVCNKCGFENRSNAKFCTKCGNKLSI